MPRPFIKTLNRFMSVKLSWCLKLLNPSCQCNGHRDFNMSFGIGKHSNKTVFHQTKHVAGVVCGCAWLQSRRLGGSRGSQPNRISEQEATNQPTEKKTRQELFIRHTHPSLRKEERGTVEGEGKAKNQQMRRGKLKFQKYHPY